MQVLQAAYTKNAAQKAKFELKRSRSDFKKMNSNVKTHPHKTRRTCTTQIAYICPSMKNIHVIRQKTKKTKNCPSKLFENTPCKQQRERNKYTHERMCTIYDVDWEMQKIPRQDAFSILLSEITTHCMSPSLHRIASLVWPHLHCCREFKENWKMLRPPSVSFTHRSLWLISLQDWASQTKKITLE